MSQEIERKFLFKVGNDIPDGDAVRIVQGYLSSVPERTVRVRIKGESGYLTIKGIGNDSGASRFEWEQEIPVSDAKELLRICEPGVIDKIRHRVNVGQHLFEIDQFFGDNEGLILVEVELAHEGETFERPEWLGEEVTGDVRYYNSMLMKEPYGKWK